ncbi:MAG TPA: putative PEP-binding protein [Baekduia sp.]|uniref:putative PEP-binding protein n=1 Tax=Baekduia sp. TaxID=2600305 RepID=UPI002D782E0B|nr:putative PEP-binding protein [Baekduia sp.]HET6506941.1 putative PEP-binding protein [Baekduia sp.]
MRGLPASPGVAIGAARVMAGTAATARRPDHVGVEGELARARGALAAAGAELAATAERLRAGGHGAEADIVDAGTLMAVDPALEQAVERHVRDGDLTAAAAIAAAAEDHAHLIASLPDPHLAARADDVRSFGRRAARLAERGEGGVTAGGAAAPAPAPTAAAAATPIVPMVIVADDLGPADVAELEHAAAVALAGGGPTAHAAIVARSLGVPMVVGLGAEALAIAEGARVIVDGTTGELVVDPDADTAAQAQQRMEAAAARRAADDARALLPAVTRDGVRVRVLTNAAGPAEVQVGLAAGAEGVGLLRTELAFLEADAWPTVAQHRALLDAVAQALPHGARPDHVLTIRLLDFGGDKTPPFLRGRPERGIAMLLAHPQALADQLKAIASFAQDTPELPLRVLIPLVEHPDQVDAVAAALPHPQAVALGAMVETPGAAAAATELARRCAFLSIGTNDLASSTLAHERFAAAGTTAPAHHPRVLANVDRSARAAHHAQIPIEVCGEAASDPTAMPLLVGLGVDELSVGAARAGTVRGWVRALDAQTARRLASRALAARDAGEVAALVEEELAGRLDEAGDQLAERVNRPGRVGAVGP